MALWIPRLEWNEKTEAGDASIGSPTIINMADTSNLVIGMICTGTGIPTGAKIASKTASSVTLDSNATANTTGATYTFFWRYDFEFPPVKDSEFVYKPKNAVAASLSGLQQVQTLHLEAERDMEFWFVNQTDADLLRDNFYLYAYKGNSFRYFPDKDEVPVYTVELNKYEFKRIRQVKKHPNFKYSLGFSIRYVVE